MSRLFGPAFQFAFVVEDIDTAIQHWTGTLGVGPFFMFPLPLELAWLELHGQRTDRHDICSAVALAYSGDTQIELITPGPDPSPYREFLDAGRSGLHHIGTVADDYDAQIAAARAAGITVELEGQLPIARFAYLATEGPVPGSRIELIDVSPAMAELLAGLKRAAVDWDGSEPVRHF